MNTISEILSPFGKSGAVIAHSARCRWFGASALLLCMGVVFAEDGKQLAVNGNTEIAAVNSPRQAGSSEFEHEKTEESKPLQFAITYKGDLLAGLSGSWRDKSAYLGNLDLKFTVAGEQAFKLPGSTLFFHILNNHGGKPNERIGATQGIDNIEVEVNTTKLLQAWFQQQFLDDKFSLLAGLYDVNSEFYVTDSSGTFIHPSFGIGAELAQTGENGPSIFPTTSFGLRGRWQMSQAWYAQAVVLDGVPGNPNNAHGTHIRFDNGDGILWLLEAGHSKSTESDKAKAAVGVWRYSAGFDDLQDLNGGGAPVRRSNAGVYALAEKTMYRPQPGSARRLDGFVRLGTANADVNQLNFSIAFGATYVGLFATRPDDTFGVGVAGAKNGGKFRALVRAAGDPAPSWEIAYELTYRAQIASWLAVQPMLQYVSYTGDAGARDATIAGLRIEASY